MKRIVKLLLCFLIAWLPYSGYAAQASLCQETQSIVAVSADAAQTHAAFAQAHVSHAGDMSAMSSHHDQAICHSGGMLCGNLTASPANQPMRVPALGANAYAMGDSPPQSQFIPDTPQRPRQLL